MTDFLYLDFETRSKVDLTVAGLDNYSRSAEILMLGWALNDGKVQLWQPRLNQIPTELKDRLENPEVQLIAWNASFERTIFHRALAMWLDYPRWRDPIILARHLSLPGGLEAVGKILGLNPNEAKMAEGPRLIDLFCYPAREKEDHNLFGIIGIFNDWNSHPQEWNKFCEYCIRDVEAERTLWKKMLSFDVPATEWVGWFFDQKMNYSIGMPVNIEFVQKALNLALRFKKESKEELISLTGLKNPFSPEQIKGWAKERGYEENSIRKDFVDNAIKDTTSPLTDEARKVLKLRQEASKNSYKKLERVLAVVSPDGRLRNQFRYMGAARTGRWAASDVQVMNLPRPIKLVEKNFQKAIDLIMAEDYATVKKDYPSVLGMVTSSLRMAFQAPPGKQMVVCDLNAIEHRALGWAARCQGILDVHRKGHDPYLDFGQYLYKRTYDDLFLEYDEGKGNKEPRQNAKPPVLGCGYGLSGGELGINEFGDEARTGLWGYALAVCGVDMPKELAHHAVKVYRETYPEVPQFWKDMEQAFKDVLKHGKSITVGEVTYKKNEDTGHWEWRKVWNNTENAFVPFTRIKQRNGGYIIRMGLPSERGLYYLNCTLEEETVKGKDGQPWTRTQIYYDGIEHSATEVEGKRQKKKQKWGRVKTYGGKLTENFVQAIARDILLNGAMLADEMGFEIFGLFHDEIAALVDDEMFAPTLGDLSWCMSQPPKWGPTLLLGAAGYTGTFYKKG